MEGGFVLLGVLMTALYWGGSDVLVCWGVVVLLPGACGRVGVVEGDCCFVGLYSLVNFFGRNVARDVG